MLMPLFPNTLLAWTFTGNKFFLTHSVDRASVTILLWGVRATFLDRHFILSNIHNRFVGKEFFIHQHSKLQQGPETPPGLFFLILAVTTSSCSTLAGDTSARVQGDKMFRTPFHKCLLILMLMLCDFCQEGASDDLTTVLTYWWEANEKLVKLWNMLRPCKYLPCKFYFSLL